MNQIEQSKEIEDVRTAEYWAKGFAQWLSGNPFTPIQNFEFNILKAKILHATAQEVSTLWPTIHKRIIKCERPKDISSLLDALSKLIETGSATYHVYTEQALVSAVSASEVYFKDEMANAIQSDTRLLNRFLDKGIKVKRILDAGLDLSEDIGTLIVENTNFQILDNVQKEYERVFGFEPFTKEELKKLKEIFAIRHVIVHKSGIVDHLFISETGLAYQVGNRLFFERDEILHMIGFIEKIVIKIDSILNKKLSSGELTP
ncbi:MAG: hypothetical protein C5S49_04580 [Candidatus Methanogaster sp.]|nr:MAG: hypothetical protein C5S49_04580 [ANME-2 cluster archaeon]